MTLNGCRLGFYEPLRKTLTNVVYSDPAVQSFGINLFAGASSGVLGAAAGSPFFLVKTRLQSYSPFLPVGTQHHYKNAVDGMRQIYSAEGIKGLYRGVGPAMVRTGFGSSVQLPTYFFAKRRLVKHLGMEEGMPLHIASSTASGFVVCCVMHPPDTIMSRMYNQTGNLYTSAFDCLSRTVKTEGILALYKGYFAHLARILPHTVRVIFRLDRMMIADVDIDFNSYTGRTNNQTHAIGRSPDTAWRDKSEDMSRACMGIVLGEPVYTTCTSLVSVTAYRT
jgi:solute carrier family 25 protein 34/35